MVYNVSSDSFTKINEKSGTIQNIDNVFTVEMSDNQTFDNGILLFPHQKHTFSGTTIFLRCVEKGANVEVRVVPFAVDVGTVTSQVTVKDGSLNIATDAEVDNMLDTFLPI